MSNSEKNTPTGPNPVDIHVGSRLRSRRILLDMSQEQLGTSIGLTFQQIQKYERGANRIGASRLYHIAQILNINVSYFFDAFEEGKKSLGFAEPTQSEFKSEDIMAKRETLDLVRAYYKIQDPKLRHQILEMAKAMAKSAN